MAKIGKRINQQLMFEAGIHGIDLSKSMPREMKPMQLTKDQQALLDARAAEAMDRVRKERQKNG